MDLLSLSLSWSEYAHGEKREDDEAKHRQALDEEAANCGSADAKHTVFSSLAGALNSTAHCH